MRPKTPPPANPPESDAREQIAELWVRFKTLQIDQEPQREGFSAEAHELHSWMCFLAGATGVAFRMRDLWRETGRDTLTEFFAASKELQPLLLGLMMGFQCGEVTSVKRADETAVIAGEREVEVSPNRLMTHMLRAGHKTMDDLARAIAEPEDIGATGARALLSRMLRGKLVDVPSVERVARVCDCEPWELYKTGGV